MHDFDTPPAYPLVPLTGTLKAQATDFQVREILGFEPSGEGEHHLVYLEKRHENTQWVASQIARLAGTEAVAVGYCGRKDRHAVTTQWFSVQCPGKAAPDWSQLASDSIKILDTARHHKKLRPGTHQGNRFEIRLTNLQQLDGSPIADHLLDALNNRLAQIAREGVPNYFGAQRFGHKGNNLEQARRWFEEKRAPRRDQRSMVLSSARAQLFNAVMRARVAARNWHVMLDGEPWETGPTGPLWGRGRSLAKGDTLALETLALETYAQWAHALEHQGLKQDRRALVLKPEALTYRIECENTVLHLAFTLPTGGFATTLIGQLLHTTTLDGEYESDGGHR